MRWANLLMALLLGEYLAATAAAVSKTICNPENPSDCYPQIFVPSHEFQVIRPGQELPLGLHIRVNLETGLKEAKIDEMVEDEAIGEDLMVVPDEEVTEEEFLDHEATFNDDEFAQEDAEINKLKQHASQHKVVGVDVQGILNYKSGSTDYDALLSSLDATEEACHDAEIGEELMGNNEFVQKLNQILELNKDNYDVMDRVYRVFASSLRNNPQALEKFLDRPQYTTYVTHLFDSLSEGQSDLIQKRILGVIQALLGSKRFVTEYFEGDGLSRLIRSYNFLGSQAKLRVITIFEDLDLITNESNIAGYSSTAVGNKKRSENKDINEMTSSYLQNRLMSGDLSYEQFKNLFRELNGLHSENKDLLPKPQFLHWLTGEMERRSNLKERDEQSLEFDKEMLEARHLIYGNPNALRKAYDEL